VHFELGYVWAHVIACTAQGHVQGGRHICDLEIVAPVSRGQAASKQAAFVRLVLVQLSDFYQASIADLQSVAGAVCPSLEGVVDIIDYCSGAGLPLLVRRP
jgi:hypothetical protein